MLSNTVISQIDIHKAYGDHVIYDGFELLIRRRDGKVETMPSLKTMMGIHPEMEMVETDAVLAAGDVALLYTDGLCSLKTSGGARFTGEAVAEAFGQIDGSADLLPRLIAHLVQRSDAQPFDDDVAAMALRRR